MGALGRIIPLIVDAIRQRRKTPRRFESYGCINGTRTAVRLSLTSLPAVIAQVRELPNPSWQLERKNDAGLVSEVALVVVAAGEIIAKPGEYVIKFCRAERD